MALSGGGRKQLEVPLLAAGDASPDGNAEIAAAHWKEEESMNGLTATADQEKNGQEEADNNDEDEDGEGEPVVTPRQLLVILFSFGAAACMLAALVQNNWMVTRNGRHIRAGLREVCFSVHAQDTLELIRRHNGSRLVPASSQTGSCVQWTELHSKLPGIVSAQALSLLRKTSDFCIISIASTFAASALLTASIVKKLPHATNVRRLGGLVAFLSGFFIVTSLSGIGEFREELTGDVSASLAWESSGVEAVLAKRLDLVVYGYCLGLNLVAAFLSILAIAWTVD